MPDEMHFNTISEQLFQARTALSMARTESDVAEDAWETLMVKIYGNLIAYLGKKSR
jgi:hypothetical protein